MKLKEKIEKIFLAVAFAEEGFPGDGMALAGFKRSSRSFKTVMEDVGASIAFAEAGEFEYAYAMSSGVVSRRSSKDLFGFLEDIGLRGASFRYGVANI